MSAQFKLSSNGRTVPTSGEYLGEALRKAADDAATKIHLRLTAANLYRLAADAYQIASGVTMGHHRAERYNEAARIAIMQAEKLEAVQS